MNFVCLAGKRALGQAHTKDYTDWAEGLLGENVESVNVAILAGMGLEKSPDYWDVEFYFRAALDDLGLVLLSERDAVLAYAAHICEQVVSGDIPPKEGLQTLGRFYAETNYQAIYSIWDFLNEDMWHINEGDGAIFNKGLNKLNQDEYIKNVAAQFIELTRVSRPENFFRLCVCFSCGYIGESALERIDKSWLPEKIYRLIYRRRTVQREICAKCGTPFPRNMYDYEARKQYLRAYCIPPC